MNRLDYDAELQEILKERILELMGDKSIPRFCKDAGIEPRTLSNILNGNNYPSFNMLLQLKNAFDVDIAWLIGESKTRKASDAGIGAHLGLREKSIRNLESVASGHGIDGYHNTYVKYYIKDDFNPEAVKKHRAHSIDNIVRAIYPLCDEDERRYLDNIGSGKDEEKFKFMGPAITYDEIMELELKTANLLLTNWNVISTLAAYFRSYSTEGGINDDDTLSGSDMFIMRRLEIYLASMKEHVVENWPEICDYYSPEEVEKVLKLWGKYSGKFAKRPTFPEERNE